MSKSNVTYQETSTADGAGREPGQVNQHHDVEVLPRNGSTTSVKPSARRSSAAAADGDWATGSLQPNTSAALHGPFHAEDFRPGERFVAECWFDGSPDPQVLRVRRVSPLAIELVGPSDGAPIALGAGLSMCLRMGAHRSRHRGLVVTERFRDGDSEVLGIRWATADQPSGADRRSVRRWACGDELAPTGYASNPARLNDTVCFTVGDISKGGFQLLTSLRNRLIVPGMVLESVVTLPAVGQLSLDLEVMNARITSRNGEEILALGVRAINPTLKSLRSLGQYVLQFGFDPAPPLDALRGSGLDVDSVNRAVDYSYVTTADDYQQVLDLRRLAYQKQYGDVAVQPPSEEWSDVQDGRVRIVLARLRGEVIGTVRLAFPGIDEPLEHEDKFTVPAHFPPRDQIVQISRVATHPGYRGSDLVMGLFSQGALVLFEGGRRYFLGDCAPHLEGLYRKVAARMSAATFRHPFGIEVRVFLVDVRSALTGAGLDPIVWNILFDEMLPHLEDADLNRDPVARGRLALYRMLSPLSELVEGRFKDRSSKARAS